MDTAVLIHDLTIGYRHADNGRSGLLLSGINVSAEEGEMVALLGRNGTGKSTLLRTLAGLQKSLGGEIYLCGKSLSAYTARELAAVVSFVSTMSLRVPYLKLFDLVAMGRFPYTGWVGQLSAHDKLKANEAIEMVGLSDMVGRHVETLSDGECQRAAIARALVQDTPVVILDEPTAFLDMPNKYEIVQLLRNLAHQQKKIIIFSTHELSLALQAADTLWVMTAKALVGGAPEDEAVRAALHEMFEGSIVIFDNILKDRASEIIK